MNLNIRLRSLERDQPSAFCPACGVPRQGPLTGVQVRVNPPGVFERYGPAQVEEQPRDRCGECGRRVVLRLGLHS